LGEKALTKAFPKMAKNANSPELIKAFEIISEIEYHVKGVDF